ncbi:MAG TPA: CPBP family glutamic-type intramembrane protease [Ignavibacteriaceae bacterium]|nr:CPBP family glutamic-type intramembrane protease [Ignavibacteriaceae bacterium]
MNSHYLSILSGYAISAILWFVIYNFYPSTWNREKIHFKRPAFEFTLAIIAGIIIIGIGQLYIHNMLIPNDGNVLIDSLNQILIFSPVIILVVIRKQSLDSLWLPTSNIGIRLIVGILLANISLFFYWITRTDANNFFVMIIEIFRYQNLSHFVQVFMEDITIALIFVRLSSWIKLKWTLVIVSALFAAGHIPNLLANDVTLLQLSYLLVDTIIAILILSAVSKSRDIWWFVIVHFVMDMTQYYGGAK